MIATIAVTAEKKSSVNAAIIAIMWFPYDRCDLCYRRTFFFSAIAAITTIVAIMWKPGFRQKGIEE